MQLAKEKEPAKEKEAAPKDKAAAEKDKKKEERRKRTKKRKRRRKKRIRKKNNNLKIKKMQNPRKITAISQITRRNIMHRILVIAALLLIPTAALYAAELNVGHFDLQRLIAQSDAGKEAREKYMSRAKNYQDELNSRAEKLKKMKEEVEGEAKKLKENEKPSANLVEKDKEYAAQFRDFQRLQGGYQDELKLYDADLIRKVMEEFTPVISAYAASNKYDYLYRVNETFAYAVEKRDVTDELVKVFNKSHRK